MTHDPSSPLVIGPRYCWRLLRAGPLKLDGGSMFGVVPRALWGRRVATDEQHRISVAHNCLLLERDANDGGPQRIVIESGSGDKFDQKNRDIFGLSDQCLHTALRDINVSPGQIDAVVLSHLHFDHAGGVTRLGPDGRAEPTFGQTPIYVQRREWEDALANRSVMTRTYLRENLDPIAPAIRLIDSADPFPPGELPDKEQPPALALEERVTQALPGVFVFRIPGHTWGQQAIGFIDPQGTTVVFTADLIPTRQHIGAAYNMAYDVEPYISTVTRRWFLHEAVRRRWLLALDHEPGNPICRVKDDGKGWFTWEEGEGEDAVSLRSA